MAPAKLKRLRLRMDLQVVAVPLDDVVVADDAIVGEATDAVEIFGSGAPSFRVVAGRASEAAIVIGQEAAQHVVGGVEIASARQAQFAGETILQDAPEAFDAPLGLRTLRGDVGDAELFEGAAELSGLALAGELFFDGPVIVVAHEDAVAIAVETEGDTEAAQEAVQQAEIAGKFRWGRTGRRGLCGWHRRESRER